MTSIPAFYFTSARTANRLVAGVPAAARLARSFGESGADAQLVLVLVDGGASTRLPARRLRGSPPDSPMRFRMWRKDR